ncbi:hypothetical protein FQN54_002635 [Arachnomyces sp. PD_36]|nr:hypothetical protein FQN54_002635 [Arachnomyces sp. PD_36]
MDRYDLVPQGGGRNYTGIFTRTIVYGLTLFLFLTGFALTLAAISLPSWLRYNDFTPDGNDYHLSLGLHKRCSSILGDCEPYPQHDECASDEGRYFCSMWRSVGFLMSLAVVIEGMSLISYVVILSGGKQRRESGSGVLSAFLVIATLFQCAAMAIVAYLYDNDERFAVGWELDDSWILCTVSWCLTLFCAAALIISRRVLPSEGGYELIPDPS